MQHLKMPKKKVNQLIKDEAEDEENGKEVNE